MKILCVTPSYWPAFHLGGPVTSVHSLNKALVKKGIDVTVYTTNTGLDDKVPVKKEVDVDGVKVVYFDIINIFEALGRTGWQLSRTMTRALKNNIKNFDLIHINSIWNYPTAAAAYYCRQFRKPYILTPRGALYEYTMKKNSWKKWPYYFLVTKRDIQGAAANHYLTIYEKNKCHTRIDLSNRSIVIPNGIEPSEFNYLPEEDNLRDRYPFLKNKKVLLFLGRIHWIKGLDILIKAMQLLVKKRDDVHLLIVGPDEGEYQKKVKKMINDCGMNYCDYESGEIPNDSDAHCTFTGMLKGEEKVRVLWGSDIFVLPSYSEGFSMSVLEAMVCRLPVIISNKCNFPEVMQRGAGIVIEPVVEQLTKSLLDLTSSQKKIYSMGNMGRQLIEEKFTWDKVAGQMENVYQEILFC